MTSVYDGEGNEIGYFDGRFVYTHIGERSYWIDDEEVFSVPTIGDEYKLGARASVKVADLVHRVAVDSEGVTVFAL